MWLGIPYLLNTYNVFCLHANSELLILKNNTTQNDIDEHYSDD